MGQTGCGGEGKTEGGGWRATAVLLMDQLGVIRLVGADLVHLLQVIRLVPVASHILKTHTHLITLELTAVLREQLSLCLNASVSRTLDRRHSTISSSS